VNIPAGMRAEQGGISGPRPGDVWTGYEWVSPKRYEEMRNGPFPDLPPMQPTSEEFAELAAEAGEARAELAELAAAPMADRRRPWEDHREPDRPRIPSLNQTARHLLAHLDPDCRRGGLEETPGRVAKAWMEWTAGYRMNPATVLKTFEDGAQGCDEMVVVRDIPVYSHCEHHLAAIFGTATVAYLPDKRIVGLSKLPRLVDVFAKRLQVQERMTNQIADALMEHLKPRGCGVVITARHMCMESRGIRQAGTSTVTSALRGVFKTDAAVRGEFLSFTR
jgi:GTP cyclohydrolase I